jgi:hypothetical protein
MPLRDGVTVEIARAGELDEPYRRPLDADTEILDARCAYQLGLVHVSLLETA